MTRLLALLIMMGAIFAPISAKAANQVQDCYQASPSISFFGGGSCQPAIQAAKSAAINVAAAATTQLVAAVTGQAIYITHWDVMAAGTNNIQLVYGTGTNCGNGQTILTGAYPLIAQAGISAGVGIGPIAFVPPGNALCIVTSGSGQLSGLVSYVQF